MNITFSRISVNHGDLEFLTGSYVDGFDAAYDLSELREYAEETGKINLLIEADWVLYSENDESGDAESATDEQLQYIAEHWDDLDLTVLESNRFYVDYEEDAYED